MKKMLFLPLLLLSMPSFARQPADAKPLMNQQAGHDTTNSYDSFPEINKGAAPKPKGPEWMHDATFYEIYPQSFYDTDGNGIGDLKGIISKLDYIKSLGVKAIWLNPFYESPFRDAGYDITDYFKVAPRYGTNADAKELFRLAKEKGLRVIIDLSPAILLSTIPGLKHQPALLRTNIPTGTSGRAARGFRVWINIRKGIFRDTVTGTVIF